MQAIIRNAKAARRRASQSHHVQNVVTASNPDKKRSHHEAGNQKRVAVDAPELCKHICLNDGELGRIQKPLQEPCDCAKQKTKYHANQNQQLNVLPCAAQHCCEDQERGPDHHPCVQKEGTSIPKHGQGQHRGYKDDERFCQQKERIKPHYCGRQNAVVGQRLKQNRGDPHRGAHTQQATEFDRPEFQNVA